MQQFPDPLEFGYIIDSESGLLVQQLMSQSVIPPELLSDSVCDCTVKKTIEQPCTQACEYKTKIGDTGMCMNLFAALAFVSVRNIQSLFMSKFYILHLTRRSKSF